MASYYLTYGELMQEISDIQYHYLDTDNLPEEVENTLKRYYAALSSPAYYDYDICEMFYKVEGKNV